MKIAKPQWNLLIYMLPPIFSSLVLMFFFPTPLFPLLVCISALTLGLSCFVWFKTLRHFEYKPTKQGIYRWLFSLFGLIFLLSISALFFIFLTAASGLSPEKLNFGGVIKIWHSTFFAGMCFLFAQLIVLFIQRCHSELSEGSPSTGCHSEHSEESLSTGCHSEHSEESLSTGCHSEHSEESPSIGGGFSSQTALLGKTQISSQIFLRLSGLVVLVASLSIVILTIANALMRSIGLQVPTGLQLPTIIGSTLIYLPFITKRWQKKRFLQYSHSRIFRFFKLALVLIIAIALISIITFPFSNTVIPIQFLDNGLATSQWELFILAWWVGITPLVANQIMKLSEGRSLSQILITLTIFSATIYGFCNKFLLHGGQEYFLAVIREGIPALLLTALPIGILVLNLLPFQRAMSIQSTRFIHKKSDRREQDLTHSLIQVTVMGCVLYWVSGLTMLFVLLLMVSIPCLMMFLVEAVAVTPQKK